jgi:hypothetical protein
VIDPLRQHIIRVLVLKWGLIYSPGFFSVFVLSSIGRGLKIG